MDVETTSNCCLDVMCRAVLGLVFPFISSDFLDVVNWIWFVLISSYFISSSTRFFYKKHLYKELEAEKGSKSKEFLRN